MEATQEILTKEQRRERALEFCRYMIRSKQEMHEQTQRDLADPNSYLNQTLTELRKLREDNKHIVPFEGYDGKL
jgi:hypothetical protein